jgi:hypothetical protein
MNRYVSLSVYGSARTYQVGALANARISTELYPDWKLVFYVDINIGPEFVRDLEALGAQVVIRDPNDDPHGMFWRFEALNLPDAEAVVFRDTDSRPSYRESLAVQEWESSNSDLHIMRDHPFHSFWILGGMWGVKGGLLSKIGQALPKYIPDSPRWGLDQEWLSHNVYKPYIQDALVHDSYFNREKSSRFPSQRVGGEYVGEAVNEFDRYSEDLRKLVRRADRHPMYVRKLQARDWFRVRMEQSL